MKKSSCASIPLAVFIASVAIILLSAITVGTHIVNADPGEGTLALYPSTVSWQVGSEPVDKKFTLLMNVTDVTNIYGFPMISVHWDTSLFDLESCTVDDTSIFGTPGAPQPTGTGGTYFALGAIYEAHGNMSGTAYTEFAPLVPLNVTWPDWEKVLNLEFQYTGPTPSIGSPIDTDILIVDYGLALVPSYKMGTKWAAVVDGAKMNTFAVLGSCHFHYATLVHDVAVTSVSAPAEATQGDIVTINVDVANPGGYDETFNVEVSYDTTLVDTQPVTLVLGDSTTIPFSWDTADVTPDTYTITAEAILAGDANLTNNNATTTILIKPPPGTIDGTVTDASTSLPIAGASITANGYTATTDENGYYTIADVPPGDYTVEASAAGYYSDSKPAHVESGVTTTVNFTLQLIVGWIDGIVTDADSLSPIEGATVTVDGYTNTTDGSGYYRIEVVPRTYSITARATGYYDNVTSVSVTADETVTVNLALEPILVFGWINGTVTDAETGSAIPDAKVTADGVSVFTNGSGYYEITIEPGTWTVNASKTGYHSNSTSATVDAGETITVDFTLTPVVHDVAVINVVPFTTEVFVGDAVDVDVIVENEGNVEESFTLNVYAGVDLVGTETATLAAGANGTYSFTWTTTAIGNFTIKAVASTVEDETDTDDNTWTTTLWRIEVIPEFPTLLPVLIMLLILAVSTIILKRRTQKHPLKRRLRQ